jgi:hypothetical protein
MRAGVDTGGTFTDLVTDDGRIVKVPSTPADPTAALRSALADVDAGDIELLAHGTTVATNALLERRGAPTALVTNRGFADVIEIARQVRPSLYDGLADRPVPLVPRELRFEVDGRLDAHGRELEPVDPASLPAIPPEVVAVAVCLLHADLDPVHEQVVAKELVARGFDVTCSHEVSPEFREYERTVTTVVNALLRPVCRRYLLELGALAPEVLVMTSAGGLLPVDEAATSPAALLLSGPAGGVRRWRRRAASPMRSRSTWAGRAPTCAWCKGASPNRLRRAASRGIRSGSPRSTSTRSAPGVGRSPPWIPAARSPSDRAAPAPIRGRCATAAVARSRPSPTPIWCSDASAPTRRSPGSAGSTSKPLTTRSRVTGSTLREW